MSETLTQITCKWCGVPGAEICPTCARGEEIVEVAVKGINKSPSPELFEKAMRAWVEHHQKKQSMYHVRDGVFICKQCGKKSPPIMIAWCPNCGWDGRE